MSKVKHEWKKKEKNYYLPKAKPEIIDVPEFNFITIEGEGNPNSDIFSEYIKALYATSYGIKMTPKKGELIPDGFYDYTVYPLEGVWDLNEEARKNFTGTINKDDFVFKLMIRQPDFVTEEYYQKILDIVIAKKNLRFSEKLKLEKIHEGKCLQMLHVGSFDDEPASFAIMEDYMKANNYSRKSKKHREIYLSDFRKVAAEKLKTVLRFQVNEVA